MLNFLNFFEESSTEGGSGNSLTSWIVIGVMLLFIVIFMVFSSRSSKKRQKETEEMLSKLAVGSIITTIGGIVGEVVQLDDEHVWIQTGTAENFSVVQFVRQAIHNVKPAPGTAEAIAEEKAERKDANEEDEIK